MQDAESGLRRLDDPDDWVRTELAASLAADGVTVVPLLIDDAQLPAPKYLPEPLVDLVTLQAIRARQDTWDNDIRPLIEQIKQLLGL